MTSINYEMLESGFKLTNDAGDHIGDIKPMLNADTQKAVIPMVWSVKMTASNIPSRHKFRSLEAAKYRALSNYIEMGGL